MRVFNDFVFITHSDKGASIEDIKYYEDRRLNRDLIEQLATNQYINEGRNILIIGATGTGKSYLACALGEYYVWTSPPNTVK